MTSFLTDQSAKLLMSVLWLTKRYRVRVNQYNLCFFEFCLVGDPLENNTKQDPNTRPSIMRSSRPVMGKLF